MLVENHTNYPLRIILFVPANHLLQTVFSPRSCHFRHTPPNFSTSPIMAAAGKGVETQENMISVRTQADFLALVDVRPYTCLMFSSNDCFFCHRMEDNFRQTIVEGGSKHLHYTSFCKVDVDDMPELAEQHDISTLPTFLLFEGRHAIGRHEGCAHKRPWHAVSQMITNALKKGDAVAHGHRAR